MSDTHKLDSLTAQISKLNLDTALDRQANQQSRDKLAETCDKMNYFIDGKNGNPGASEKIRTLEKKDKARGKWIGFFAAAIGTLGLKSLWEMLFKQ